MARLPILQSGFVSTVTAGLEKTVAPVITFQQMLLMKQPTPLEEESVSQHFFSKDIYKLYSEWSVSPEVIRNFEFRERVLNEAYTSFNSKSFQAWLNIQAKYALMTQLHIEFVIDTLEYLFNDKPRSIRNIQWIQLLKSDTTAQRYELNVSKYFLDANTPSSSFLGMNPTMDSIIQRWTSKPDGFVDLLICLYVIFGERGVGVDNKPTSAKAT